MTARQFQVSTLAIYAIAIAALIAASWWACGGHFVYALDDPYIHLSIAENIARGGYGINLGEYASPSSSILYPFLLAPFALAGADRLAPLALGVLANALTFWLVAGFFFRRVIADATAYRPWAWLAICPFLLLGLNGIGLPLVGMEHPLHILVVVGTMLGLITFAESGRVGAGLVAGVLLAPLIRFEGLALSGAVLLVLGTRGRWGASLILAAILGASLALYGAFMRAHGLPLLPSSVMVKSAASAAAVDSGPMRVIHGMLGNLATSLEGRWGKFLALGVILLAPPLFAYHAGASDRSIGQEPESRQSRAMVAFCGIAAICAHLLLGAYGWFGRYEVYVVAIMLLSVSYCHAGTLRRMRPYGLRLLVCALVLAVPAFSYVRTTLKTPAATRNIYQQQYQLHRFATEYFPHSVAVIDIGLISYRNDNYVLDLWGLGSEEARRMLGPGHRTKANVAAIVQRHRVPYAMVFDSWLPGAIPDDWQPLAHLTTSKVISGDAEVTFYLTDPSRRAEMLQALAAFAPTLPPGAVLTIDAAPAPLRGPDQMSARNSSSTVR